MEHPDGKPEQQADKPRHCERQARRLTTILVADICGYSKMSERDQDHAIRIADLLYKVFETTTERHGGRVFKRIADGFLAEFPSARSGMLAALDYCKEIKARNNLAPNAIEADVRAGIHVGDVSDRPDGDILGHGVNIAARLQEQAEPGMILASSNIVNLLGKDFPHHGHKRANLSLKNISTPITVFEIDPENRSFFKRTLNKLGRFKASKTTALFAILVIIALGFGAWNVFQTYENRRIADAQHTKLVKILDQYDQGNELDRRYLSELLFDLEYIPTGDLVINLIENKKVSEAINQLKSSLEDITIGDPEYIKTLHYIGALAYQTAPNESQSAYRLILDLDPNDVQAMIRLARVNDVLGESEIALELFEKAYAATINLEQKYWLENDIAFNHLILGNYKKGLEIYETLYNRIGSEIEEDSRIASRIYTDLGVAYYLTGNRGEAKTLAVTAIKKQKKDGHFYDLARSHSLLGFLLIRESEEDPVNENELLNEALYHYQKQLEYSQSLNNPRRIDEAMIGIGQVSFKLGNIEHARKYLGQASMSTNPLQKFEAHLSLSELELSLGYKNKACEHLFRVKETHLKIRTNIGPDNKTRIKAIICDFSFFD